MQPQSQSCPVEASQGAYDDDFFSYTTRVSSVSAKAIIPVVRNAIGDINSVLDLGCAWGAWLRNWRDAGVEDVFGLDGDHVDPAALLIPKERFRAHDLNEPVDLGRRFDLAQCLEVAEHLYPAGGVAVVNVLTRHADRVLFSAAPPGQGGEHHVNEQPYDYWRRLFKERGFHAYDCLRPRIRDMKQISYWYRYNLLLFVKEGAETSLRPEALATRIPDGSTVPDISPPHFRLRKSLVRLLPRTVEDRIARAKAALLSRP